MPNFGWKHKQAGKKYSENEKSFRQTINEKSASDRGFLEAIETADILIDFDARTGHNHGTKFRIRQNCLPALYETVKDII